MKHAHSLWLAAALLLGCGGGDDAPASTADAAKDVASSVASVSVKVDYGGTRKGPLTIGAFTAPVPDGPPVSFDTSKSPAFPYEAKLLDLEPGRYWIVAVIDLEPLSGTAVRPGPEDLQITSTAIDVAAGDTKTVELLIDDARDAGTEAGTDAPAD